MTDLWPDYQRELWAPATHKRVEGADTLSWWKSFADHYPTLKEVVSQVIDCLHVPVVVTDCDSVLSVEGALFTCRQSTLSSDKAGALLQHKVNRDLLSGRNDGGDSEEDDVTEYVDVDES